MSHRSCPIICVGAVYIDTILTIPHFPKEDTKLRASKRTRRRGGNTANSLEVLAQLLPQHDQRIHYAGEANAQKSLSCCGNSGPSPPPRLYLLTVLPSSTSPAIALIASSLPTVNIHTASVFRADHTEVASSYVLYSLANQSRTIVSINELPELSAKEFEEAVARVWGELQSRGEEENLNGVEAWIHFEGRIPSVTLSCVQLLRQDARFKTWKISLECEKPERSGLSEVAALADAVFYSRLWAEAQGFESARLFLEGQLRSMKEGALICCTWGAGGAVAVEKCAGKLNYDIGSAGSAGSEVPAGEEQHTWASTSAWHPPDGASAKPVDSIGAGDTFVAGMLFSLSYYPKWTLQKRLEFANELAGRKVFQEGFAGLGEAMILSNEENKSS